MTDSNTTARTSLEKIQRKIVDEAADELVGFLQNMPEHGSPDGSVPARVVTREKVERAFAAIKSYLGKP